MSIGRRTRYSLLAVSVLPLVVAVIFDATAHSDINIHNDWRIFPLFGSMILALSVMIYVPVHSGVLLFQLRGLSRRERAGWLVLIILANLVGCAALLVMKGEAIDEALAAPASVAR